MTSDLTIEKHIAVINSLHISSNKKWELLIDYLRENLKM